MNAMPMNADYQPALHNCGPSPNAVYRTAPAGRVHLLDLFGELQRSRLVPKCCKAHFAPRPTEYDEQLPNPSVVTAPASTPEMVVPMVAAIMRALPPVRGDAGTPSLKLPNRVELSHARKPSDPAGPFSKADALEAVRQLAAHLMAIGELVPVHGLVSWTLRTPLYGAAPEFDEAVGKPLPWLATSGDAHGRAIRIGWLVCAFSYAAPPLVLFTRTPSLRYWRADGGLQVRWLGQSTGAVR